MPTGRVVGIFFSSGDLGDVGRHAVAAALEMSPSVVSNIRVFSRDIASIDQADWKCGCGAHSISQEDRNRIQFLQIDCTKDNLVPALLDVDAIVSCLGSRQPFHNERIVREGTERLVQAAIRCKIARFVMISSVGYVKKNITLLSLVDICSHSINVLTWSFHAYAIQQNRRRLASDACK
jgi:nucleoside-diphosphate-sugar epimerase